MIFIDYYMILGVDRNIDQEGIQKAYLKLVKKHHPDLHPKDSEAQKNFQAISDAHEVLSDVAKRKKYNIFVKKSKKANPFNKTTGSHKSDFNSLQQTNIIQGTTSFSLEELSSFYESIFNQPSQYSPPKTIFRGKDIHVDYQIKLSELQKSEKRIFEINDKKIRIKVPAGLRNGQMIKVQNLGKDGKDGGPNGDLYITFHVINDTNFRRESSTLYKKVEIDIPTAVLGGVIEVDSLRGKVKLVIKPNTSGDKVSLKGKGFNKYKEDNKYGDLIVELVLKIPENLTKEDRELYKKLNKELVNG